MGKVIRLKRDDDEGDGIKETKRERVETADNAIKLEMDMDMAQRFLDLLGKKHVFQTFDDVPGRDIRELAIILHGTLDQRSDQLCKLNLLRAGVFATLNETDYRGKCKENIKRIRAVTLDLDGEPLEPVKTCKLQPHIIVESSPGKYHCYWLVRDLPCHQFEDVQRSIAKKFDGDPAVALLTHNARIPGFYHCKKEPFFRTRIIEVNEREKYSGEEILAEFPPLKKAHKPSGSRKGSAVLYAGSPLKSAEAFVRQVYAREGAHCLAHYRGNFYAWVSSHYEQEGDDLLRSKAYEYLDKQVTINKEDNKYKPFNPDQTKVNRVIDALKAGVVLDSKQNPPFWFGKLAHVKGSYVACRNGLLDLDKRELMGQTPFYFNLNCVPFDFNAKAPEPELWTKFLKQLWPNEGGDDEKSRLVLQEMFGLMLAGDTSHQKIFLMVGPPRSGRGTIARVVTAMLGEDNVANPTLGSLPGRFGRQPLIGKKAAIIPEARLGPKADSHAIAERLLSISGEDRQTSDVKNRNAWTGNLDTLFLILSNEQPWITDASGALASRYVVLNFRNSFLGREDNELTGKLKGELPGILNWALDGLERLRKRGRFEMPASSTETIRELGDLGSPVGTFVREWCETTKPFVRENVKTMFGAWQYWCEENGYRPSNAHVFGRDLRTVLPHLKARGRGQDRFYDGVSLSEEGRAR